MLRLVEGWIASSHTDAVWQYLATLGGLERERGSQVVVRHLVSQVGAEGALRRIEQLPDEPPLGAFKDKVRRTAVALVARSQPAAAIAVVEAHRGGPAGAPATAAERAGCRGCRSLDASCGALTLPRAQQPLEIDQYE